MREISETFFLPYFLAKVAFLSKWLDLIHRRKKCLPERHPVCPILMEHYGHAPNAQTSKNLPLGCFWTINMQQKMNISVICAGKRIFFCSWPWHWFSGRLPAAALLLEVDDQRTKTHPPPASASLVNILPGVSCTGMPRSAITIHHPSELVELQLASQEVHASHSHRRGAFTSFWTGQWSKTRTRKIKLSILLYSIYHLKYTQINEGYF